MRDCCPNKDGQKSWIFPYLFNVSGLITYKIQGSLDDVFKYNLPLRYTQLTSSILVPIGKWIDFSRYICPALVYSCPVPILNIPPLIAET